jgi:hypothetical protein
LAHRPFPSMMIATWRGRFFIFVAESWLEEDREEGMASTGRSLGRERSAWQNQVPRSGSECGGSVELLQVRSLRTWQERLRQEIRSLRDQRQFEAQRHLRRA